MERSCEPKHHNSEKKSCNVPCDITLIILSLMPYKSALKFKCVCKAWCTLISNEIAESYLKRCRENSQGLLVCHNGGTEENPCLHISSLQTEGGGLKTLMKLPEINLKGRSVDEPAGIILLQPAINGLVSISNEIDFYVCNPMTGEFVTLPAYNGQHNLPPPCSYFNGIGFGYASSTKEYKVVRIFNDNIRDFSSRKMARVPIKCAVITVGSLSDSSARLWRDVEYSSGYPLLPDSVCVNGIIYWSAMYSRDDIIVTFDVRKEKFKGIVGPPADHRYQCARSLAQHKGSVCVITFRGTLNFWMMAVPHDDDPDFDHDQFFWVKLYEIPLRDFRRYRPRRIFDIDFSWLDRGKLILRPCDGKARWSLYDIKSRLQEEIDLGFIDCLSHRVISGFEESLETIVRIPSAASGHEMCDGHK